MSDARVRQVCEAQWDAHKADCSGFAKAVAGALGVPLVGTANEIADALRAGAGWVVLADGIDAARAAREGRLVVAGLRGEQQRHVSAHGHVVVVVDGVLAHGKYPPAYWGQLGNVGKKDTTLNFAWNAQDRDRITYAQHELA